MATPVLWGNQFLVNTSIKGDQEGIKLRALKNGTFLAVWEDDRHGEDRSDIINDTSGTAIRGQIFNADGSKSGDEFIVNAITEGNQRHQSIVSLPDGGFAVVYADYGTEAGLRVAVFNSEGVRGEEHYVALPLADRQSPDGGPPPY